jgi:histidinol dehydrogenase
MKTFNLPSKNSWTELVKRPAMNRKDLDLLVKEILKTVKQEGDNALLGYSEKFDGVKLENLKVSLEEINEAENLVNSDLKDAIRTAAENIRTFHAAQLVNEQPVETFTGISCWRKSVPIEKAGLYIPGGSAPLFSTILMLAIPAQIAGCSEIILCSPPGKDGKLNPAILFTARLAGIASIFKTGGAQAIAAMAYGTETIPSVYKIFGPGNQFVTRAKEMVQLEGISIDMPAGPSEVLVISDDSADPQFIASDLLSQAEHGPDSQAVYLTDSREMIEKVLKETELQLSKLPRREIASKALENSLIVRLSSLDECMEFSNMYAPEHLIINTSEPEVLAGQVVNAGSVFLGPWSCESAGDYASGTNHTLPTSGHARSHSGVSTDSFMRKITFQKINEDGIRRLGPVIEKMAEAEMLEGHRNAVSIRLKSLNND